MLGVSWKTTPAQVITIEKTEKSVDSVTCTLLYIGMLLPGDDAQLWLITSLMPLCELLSAQLTGFRCAISSENCFASVLKRRLLLSFQIHSLN